MTNTAASEELVLPEGLEALIRQKLEVKTGEIDLSKNDKRLAKAISDASFYTTYSGRDNALLTYNFMASVIKKCRYFYDKEKPDISFVDYVKQDIEKTITNSTECFNYYKGYL